MRSSGGFGRLIEKMRGAGSGLSRRTLWSAIGLVVVLALVAGVAYTWGKASRSEQAAPPNPSGSTGTNGETNPGTNPGTTPGATPPSGGAKQLNIWLTGYSWQDNTPPGSSIVGEPVLHKEAGGTGTFADPITVAVPGHQGDMDWQPGTKFYLSSVQRYVIVEDSGAAKPPSGDDTHLDMWIGGQDGTKATTDACENELTGNVPAQASPPANLPVMAGPIFAGGKCNIPPQTQTQGTYKGGNDDSSDSDSGGDDDGSGGHHHHHHHSDDNN
ncbi:MAG TPA: hypothetical protein VFE65_34095 [Pseudonocardia sp.]|nr:hypothetical protein [Pseudonocardia sp.]